MIYDKTQAKVIPSFAAGNAPSSGGQKASTVKATNVKTAAGHVIKENRHYFYTDESSLKVPKEIWGVRLTEGDAKDLLDGKELPPRSFTWSSGKRSKAKVSLDQALNKIKYNFK